MFSTDAFRCVRSRTHTFLWMERTIEAVFYIRLQSSESGVCLLCVSWWEKGGEHKSSTEKRKQNDEKSNAKRRKSND